MTLHTEAISPPSDELVIESGDATRLLVREWEAANGRRMVTIAPQFRDRGGQWRLSHSGLILSPDVARELAPALLAMAATIEGAPTDPMPTEQDRDESRMP